MTTKYDDMVAAIYAGQAIERLSPDLKRPYVVSDLAKALGYCEDLTWFRQVMRNHGYRSEYFGEGRSYEFNYIQAVVAIKRIALDILAGYEPK